MISDLLRNPDDRETTASAAVRHLAAAGVGREHIRGEHLAPLYAAMSRSANTPLAADFHPPRLEAADPVVSDSVWGVIIETREHPDLETVVCSFRERLGIGIQLFHGNRNAAFIRQSGIGRLVERGCVHLTPVGDSVTSLRHCNALMLSTAFWNALKGRRKILVFQADCVLNPHSGHRLSDFEAFDYIGSTWERRRPTGMIADGGNGGLSLRDWARSVACLERFPPGPWPGGEDGYFAFHIELAGGRVARADESARFSVEGAPMVSSFGGHKVPARTQPPR